jgi:hypothetical protein
MAFIARWVRWLFVSTPVNELDGVEYFEEPTRAGVRARVPVIFEIGTSGWLGLPWYQSIVVGRGVAVR